VRPRHPQCSQSVEDIVNRRKGSNNASLAFHQNGMIKSTDCSNAMMPAVGRDEDMKLRYRAAMLACEPGMHGQCNRLPAWYDTWT
jgi:hypothetical protein